MDEDTYLRLYRELNASRFDSNEANTAIEQLGATGRVIRALARARRHCWTSARADLRAAVAASDIAPLVEFVAGVTLYVARDYDLALTTLARAAGRGKPGIAKQARMYALRFAERLGFTEQARALEAALGKRSGVAAPEAPADIGAHELDDEASQDPRLLYLRARDLFARDEFTPASELLERARVMLPTSVPINLALALARHHEAPDTFNEGLERRFEDLVAWAPGLLASAAEGLGLELWTDNGLIPEREAQVELLTGASALLTAEVDLARPSYRFRGQLRHVPPVESLRGPTPLDRLHQNDRKLLEHIDGTLVRAIGVKPPRPDKLNTEAIATRTGVWKPCFLSPAQIEQFLVDGFIVLPRAFDPELARAWREDAKRRIREEPERWVRGYDPSDERRSLRNFSADDRKTWTWGRLELEGPQTREIEEVAPQAWAAICDLLGGPERVKTRTWKNYLIINFCEDDHLPFDKPEPQCKSWHIDDPSPTTRLDRILNGLVGIVLYDRLLPRSGNTWLAPDSVGRVARKLAAHPEGVDFIVDRGNQITAQCERFHEVVGDIGDVVLMHPLMMHSPAPNRSGRPRWMSNPMIYLNDPLDPFRPVAEMSPVELAIHRAIND